MKAAVVFYSYDGNSAFAAEQIGLLLKADLLQIQPVKERRALKFWKIIVGVGQVMFNKKPALKPYSFNSSDYDLIILGTPVWAGSPAPAIKSFLSQEKLSGKKLALFACHAGGPGDVMQKLKAELKDNTIVSEIDFLNPASEQEKAKQKIEEWVKTLTQ
ncbi:MAG: flavodoxin [Treponema sp.]|jgi:flavodoxin|nr:flavodoxin [Treponema sp.]